MSLATQDGTVVAIRMRYVAAILPICLVLVLMIRFRWGAHRAGAAGLLCGILIAHAWFGLTPQVLWVSQVKGLLLSVFVLAVMWPALLLYHWIDQNDGIRALAKVFESAVKDRGMCLLLLAWALSGALEGIAGFGLPIAVVAPMLTALGVAAPRAVAAVAIGHSWAVTFGDMGVILQTLSAVVAIPVPSLVPFSGLLLGTCVLVCGLGAAWILGTLSKWPKITVLSAVIGLSQFGVAASGLVPLSAFVAGLSGLAAFWVAQQVRSGWFPNTSGPRAQTLTGEAAPRESLLPVSCYGGLLLLMALLSIDSPLRKSFQEIEWRPSFPAVATTRGFETPAALGQSFRPLLHPGSLVLVITLGSVLALAGRGMATTRLPRAFVATWRSASLTSLGIIVMVGLSTLMEHCGMSYLLAQGLAATFGHSYPLVSPLVGILGAFATGSNNNSNVLFGGLQKNVAVMLGLKPELLASAQTAGGSLGSMLAPAKILVGCSTVGEIGREGAILKRTVPFGLAAGTALGVVTWLLSR